MKNTIKLFGLIALAAVIGFSITALSLTGCDNGTTSGSGGGGDRAPANPFIGTWTGTDSYGNSISLVCNDTTWTLTIEGWPNPYSGIYTREGNKVTFILSGSEVGMAIVTDTTTMTGEIIGFKFTITKKNSGGNGTSDWTSVTNSPFETSSLGDNVSVITYGNGKFIAGGYTINGGRGNGKMAYSSDGINWTEITNHPFYSSDATGDEMNSVDEIAYGNNTFVVGLSGYYTKMACSSDGINWTAVTDSKLDLGYHSYYHYNRVFFVNDRFVAILGSGLSGGNKMAYSFDGINWTSVPDDNIKLSSVYGSGAISSIIYINGTFIALGYVPFLIESTGVVITSADCINWTHQMEIKINDGGYEYSGPNGTFSNNNFAYGNGKVLSYGDNYGHIYYSSDGLTWTKVSILNNPFYNGTSGWGIRTIAYGNGKYIAVGDVGNQSNDVIAYSTDGIIWTEEKNSTLWAAMAHPLLGDQVHTIAYGNNRFVAGGSFGKIAYLLDN